MAYSILPIAGVNLVGTTPISFTYVNGSTTETIPAFGPLGTEVFGSDGLRYVFAKAAEAITASTATSGTSIFGTSVVTVELTLFRALFILFTSNNIG